MAEIIVFPGRPAPRQPIFVEEDDPLPELDLLTAIDLAIRDLRQIERTRDLAESREIAAECRRMLREIFDQAQR
jgi:hypothetical protein